MEGFQVGDSLGSGGFGEVFEATRTRDGAEVAIKQLAKTEDDEARQRFAREVKLQKPLSDEHIVPILEFGIEGGAPWYAMPLANCGLDDLMGEVDEGTKLDILIEAAHGVQFAHENGRIHRDLKPGNVLIFEDDDGTRAAVSDFGLGRFVESDQETLTQSYQGMGTPFYTAPEQFHDAKSVDERADVFSLGKILAECIGGTPTVGEPDLSDVDSRYAYIVEKACRTDPDERYNSVAALIDELEALREDKEYFTKSSQQIRQKAQSLVVQGEVPAEELEEFADEIAVASRDNEVLMQVVPRLPEPVLQSLFNRHFDHMEPVLAKYDDNIKGQHLPFDYCDVVADFYQLVFSEISDYGWQRRILERLAKVGTRHDRWHVGRVFARMVADIDEDALVRAVGDILENPKYASWLEEYLTDQGGLPKGIHDTLQTTLEAE